MKHDLGRVAAAAVALTACKFIWHGALSPQTAPASIIKLSGAARQYSAPPSVALNAWESNRRIRVFQENADVALKEDLSVDITTSGIYKRRSDMTHGVIEQGTPFDVYLIHQDGKNNRGGRRLTLRGSVRFDREILGVILSRNLINGTDDSLGHDGTYYPSLTRIARGLELGSTRDWIKISTDRRTISFRLYSGNSMDEFRVLTNAAPVPEAGSAALLLLAGLTAARRRRRHI
jgi:hypothetical protein